MKKFVYLFISAIFLAGFATASTNFTQRADQLSPQNSGTVYEMGSRGFVVIEGKRSGKIGEKLSPRVVVLSRKPLVARDSECKVNLNPASTHVYEIDLLKFEF